jgi:hypothetical protein
MSIKPLIYNDENTILHVPGEKLPKGHWIKFYIDGRVMTEHCPGYIHSDCNRYAPAPILRLPQHIDAYAMIKACMDGKVCRCVKHVINLEPTDVIEIREGVVCWTGRKGWKVWYPTIENLEAEYVVVE